MQMQIKNNSWRDIEDGSLTQKKISARCKRYTTLFLMNHNIINAVLLECNYKSRTYPLMLNAAFLAQISTSSSSASPVNGAFNTIWDDSGW